MQIVPATGRRLARTLGIRRFTHVDADQPRNQHPARHAVLLEAGRAVRRHLLRAGQLQRRREPRRPLEGGASGLDEDEFIDDIPFPETQNYVKRILGTAEDYRLLYGKGGGRPIPVAGRLDSRADHAVDQAASRAGRCRAGEEGHRESRRRRSRSAKKTPAKKAATKKPVAKHEPLTPHREGRLRSISLRPAHDLVNPHALVRRDRPQIRQVRLQPGLDLRCRLPAVEIPVDHDVARAALLQAPRSSRARGTTPASRPASRKSGGM